MIEDRIEKELRLGKLLIELTHPENCPICSSPMKGVEIRTKVSRYECTNCGFKRLTSESTVINTGASSTDLVSSLVSLAFNILFIVGFIKFLEYLFDDKEK